MYYRVRKQQKKRKLGDKKERVDGREKDR